VLFPYCRENKECIPTDYEKSVELIHVIVEKKKLEKKDENEKINQVLYFEIEKRREIFI